MDFANNKDAKVVKIEEVRMSQAKDRTKRRSWQAVVFVIAALKYYLLSCVLQTTTVYELVQKDTDAVKSWQKLPFEHLMPERMTFVFACLFFGNLVDN